MRSGGWTPHERISALIRKDSRESVLSLCHCEDTVRRQSSTSQERGLSPEANQADTLILDFSLQNYEQVNLCCLLSSLPPASGLNVIFCDGLKKEDNPVMYHNTDEP